MAIADRFIVLDGLRFHYREAGDPAAPPVVLPHTRRRDELVAALRSFLEGDGDCRVG